MGAGPVEDGIRKGGDAGPKTVNISVGETPPQTGSEYFGTDLPPGVAPEGGVMTPNADRAQAGLPPLPKPATSPEEELIKAQHLFIEGLLNFIHDKSQVAMFAGEQEQYIRASMKYAGAKLDQK